jgi:hypothetical protein
MVFWCVEKYNNSQLVYYYNKIIIVNSQLVYFFHILVYWIVSNKPVIYGDTIILTCKTGHVLTDRGDACGVRQWYSGQMHFLYNGVSRDATKYEDRTNISSTEFSLVIENYTVSDINIYYTCSCGLKSYTKRLGLNDNNFICKHIN